MIVANEPGLSRGEPVSVARCADCRHGLNDRQAIEQRISGLAVFGSAYGASIGSSRLCVLHDRLVSPDDGCARFKPLEQIDA
ncbi:hypothetical protein [Rhodanobacter sp. BL-MT-08]